ncbi:hypothetical protein [Nocardioides zeae]
MAGPALWLRDTTSLVVVLLFAIVWLVTTSLSALRWTPTRALSIAEAIAVAAICGYAVVRADAVPVLALAVPPFLGGLDRGIRGAAGLVLVEIAVLAVVLGQLEERPPATVGGQVVATLAFGLGVGLVGAYVRFTQGRQAELTPYRDAIDLLQQLLALSDVLDAGLDPQSIGARLLSTLQDDIPAIRASLWLRDERGLTPVPTGSLLESAHHGGWSRGTPPTCWSRRSARNDPCSGTVTSPCPWPRSAGGRSSSRASCRRRSVGAAGVWCNGWRPPAVGWWVSPPSSTPPSSSPR